MTLPILSPLTRSSVAVALAIVNAAAGTSVLISGVANLQTAVFDIMFSMNASGTFKWNGSVTGDLSGPIDVGGTGTACQIIGSDRPVMWAAVGEDLKLVVTGGTLHGWITYAQIAPDGSQTD